MTVRIDGADLNLESIAKSGSSKLYGDVALVQGGGVTISQAGQDITITTVDWTSTSSNLDTSGTIEGGNVKLTGSSIEHDASTVADLTIENKDLDKDIIFKANDGGASTEVLRINGDIARVDVANDLYLASGKKLLSAAGYYLMLNDGSGNMELGGGMAIRIKGSWDGWIDPVETWTYASSTTFTVPGDVTAKYPKGTKIKLTQTSIKYFYVIATAYADTTTTVTVTGGSDYSLADAAITSPYYSHSSTPQGFPQHFNFAPASTGFSGTPTEQATFSIKGNRVFIDYWVTGTSNATTLTFEAPVVPANTDPGYCWICKTYDNSATTYSGRGTMSKNDATVTIGKDVASSGGFTASNTKTCMISGASYRI